MCEKCNKKPYYITTAIAYTSRKPHIGNSYEIVLTDAIARYKRMQGYDVFFQTGTDEHGQKIEMYAQSEGCSPKEYVDKISGEIRDICDVLNTSYDYFIRTTDPQHEKTVQKIFKKLYEQGDIYKGSYEGLYCTPCESFWTETQLVDGKCPDCGREVKPTKEEAYFLRLSKYQKQLEEYIESHPDFIYPESRKKEMLNNFIKPGLQDLCVSRTSFKWGIPVDFDPNHALPKQVFGHPWLLFGEDKMSKSRGNVIYADELVKLIGVDAVRYYLLSEMPFGNDGSASYETIIERFNSDLANTLGNLVNRTIAMNNKYFDGIVQAPTCPEPLDDELKQFCLDTVKKVDDCITSFHISDALETVMSLAKRCNKYIDETAPWVLAKDEAKRERLGTVLYDLLEAIRYVAVLLLPFMPDTHTNILSQLNCDIADYDSLAEFGKTVAGTKLGEPVPLFVRIDPEKLYEEIVEMQRANAAEEKAIEEIEEEIPEIPIDDFAKCDIRVGEVKACEKIKKSKKLLKFNIFDGSGERTIVSGIAKFYQPEDLVGKKILFVSNLKPVKLCGVESRGMILSAVEGEGDDERLQVLTIEGMPAGSKIC